MELAQIEDVATRACKAGMAVVREYQLSASARLDVEVKEDATLLTLADKASQEAIRQVLEPLGFAFWGEEGGTKGFIGAGRYGANVDPLDGTNAFVVGLTTSTVIVGIYDRQEKKLVACAIGEPISGRIWSATGETPTTLDGAPRQVWSGNGTGTVFLDVCHGFKSRGRQVLTHRGNADLYTSLNSTYKILLPGSNGLMQALVANGRQRMAGSITTAVGFPGDVCGALLVKQAGGVLKAYARDDSGGLVETDPLDPLGVDALICANNPETLAVLARAFEDAGRIT